MDWYCSSYSSMHQWGIAFDFYRNDGKGAYNNNDGFFNKVGAIGQKLGLTAERVRQLEAEAMDEMKKEYIYRMGKFI